MNLQRKIEREWIYGGKWAMIFVSTAHIPPVQVLDMLGTMQGIKNGEFSVSCGIGTQDVLGRLLHQISDKHTWMKYLSRME